MAISYEFKLRNENSSSYISFVIRLVKLFKKNNRARYFFATSATCPSPHLPSPLCKWSLRVKMEKKRWK